MVPWMLEVVLTGLGLVHHGNATGPVHYIVPADTLVTQCKMEPHATVITVDVDAIREVDPPGTQLPITYSGGRTVARIELTEGVATLTIGDQLAALSKPANPVEGVAVTHLAPVHKVDATGDKALRDEALAAPDGTVVKTRLDIKWPTASGIIERPALTARRVGRSRADLNDIVQWKVNANLSQALTGEAVFRVPRLYESVELSWVSGTTVVTLELAPPLWRPDRTLALEVATLPTTWQQPVGKPTTTRLHHLTPTYFFFEDLDCDSPMIEAARKPSDIDFVGSGSGTFCLPPGYP